MIISVEKLKQFITTDVSDTVLGVRLSALETLIRKKTNNNFQDRRYRTYGAVVDGTLTVENASLFAVGDTIMVGEDLCEITAIFNNVITVNVSLLDNPVCLVTKVVYPNDIIMGVVDIMGWILSNPSENANISSETISRHSVTYSGSDEFDSDIGCPKRLVSFLRNYTKARF